MEAIILSSTVSKTSATVFKTAMSIKLPTMPDWAAPIKVWANTGAQFAEGEVLELKEGTYKITTQESEKGEYYKLSWVF